MQRVRRTAVIMLPALGDRSSLTMWGQQIGLLSRLPVTGFIQGLGRRLCEITPDGKRFLGMLP